MSNTTIYKALGRHPVHPFPARMAPEIVCSFIKSAKKPIRVLDPMMGSGTVIALAQSSNHSAIGFDIDPLATLIARVWVTPLNHEKAETAAQDVLMRAKSRAKSVRADTSFPSNSTPSTREFIAYWFDGRSRKQLFCLSEEIKKVKNHKTRDLLWCAFSRLIITKQAGASRALDLAHSRPHRHYEQAPLKPFDGFTASVKSALKCVVERKTENAKWAKASVRLGDARKLRVETDSIDLVITSPPYLNAIDYIRCSKFSLVWMGHQIDGLRELRAKSVGTEVGIDHENNPKLSRIIRSLEIPDLPKRKQAILAAYIEDMRKAISEVARVLTPGGKAIYVIGENMIKGNFIRTSKVLSLLARDAGLRVTSTEERVLPPNRRYLPPPTKGSLTMDTRMRTEVILHFAKPKKRSDKQRHA